MKSGILRSKSGFCYSSNIKNIIILRFQDVSSQNRKKMLIRMAGFHFKFSKEGDDVAKCEVKMPEEIYRAIEKLTENKEKILTSTLEAGGEIVLNAVRSNLNRAIRNSSNRSTGELRSSLGMSPVKLSSRGIYNVKIGFAEPRRKQYVAKKKRSYYVITNAMIANVLEYGKTGQAPRPFMRPAKVASEKAAISAMKAKFDEEVKKRGLK